MKQALHIRYNRTNQPNQPIYNIIYDVGTMFPRYTPGEHDSSKNKQTDYRRKRWADIS